MGQVKRGRIIFVVVFCALLVEQLNGLMCLRCESEEDGTHCREGNLKFSEECHPDTFRPFCYLSIKETENQEASVWRGCAGSYEEGPNCRPLSLGTGKVCDCVTDNCNDEPYVPSLLEEKDEHSDENSSVVNLFFWLCNLLAFSLGATVLYTTMWCVKRRSLMWNNSTGSPSTNNLIRHIDTTSV